MADKESINALKEALRKRTQGLPLTKNEEYLITQAAESHLEAMEEKAETEEDEAEQDGEQDRGDGE